MKRAADGKVKPKTITDMFGGGKSSKCGSWEAVDNDAMIYTHEGVESREKVAAFDMDGTIITPKSGRVFPKDTSDWMMLDDRVIPKLKELHEKENFQIVFFTNQKGILTGKLDRNAFKIKVENIVSKIGIPIKVYTSVGTAHYRKPAMGMWNHFVNDGHDKMKVNMEESVFVGDAAGRHKTKSRPKKDHSCADRFFSLNIGLPFKTPEQFFFKEETDEPWGPPSFDAKAYLAKNMSELEPEDTPLPLGEPEVIVMVGSPGSGKSTFARRIAEEHGYHIVNRDTLGTWQKCVQDAKKALQDGKSVIVDNTNPDKESRERYTAMALASRVKCRCFVMNSNYNMSEHNVRFRLLNGSGGPEISSMVLRMHQNKYQKPDLDEGFSSIVHVNFVPKFKTEKEKELWSMYLTEM